MWIRQLIRVLCLAPILLAAGSACQASFVAYEGVSQSDTTGIGFNSAGALTLEKQQFTSMGGTQDKFDAKLGTLDSVFVQFAQFSGTVEWGYSGSNLPITSPLLFHTAATAVYELHSTDASIEALLGNALTVTTKGSQDYNTLNVDRRLFNLTASYNLLGKSVLYGPKIELTSQDALNAFIGTGSLGLEMTTKFGFSGYASGSPTNVGQIGTDAKQLGANVYVEYDYSAASDPAGTVPEPSSLLLMALSFGGAATAMHRRKRLVGRSLDRAAPALTWR